MSGMLSQFEALIDSLPPQYVKHDDPMVDKAAARWLRELDPERREALHRELIDGLPLEDARHDQRFFWIAHLERSAELVEHAVPRPAAGGCGTSRRPSVRAGPLGRTSTVGSSLRRRALPG